MKGTLVGELLTDDLSAHLFIVQIEAEEIGNADNIPVLGDQVEVS